jgi:hypothetical protein
VAPTPNKLDEMKARCVPARRGAGASHGAHGRGPARAGSAPAAGSCATHLTQAVAA